MTMPRSPNFGGKSLPVRLRPPSMNTSIGYPLTNQASDMRVDSRGVQTVTLEAAPDEEGAAAPKDRRAEEVEIVARGNQRQLNVLAVEDVAQMG